MSLALADELFLITHDLRSGRPRIPAAPLGIGLTAALLSELLYAGSLVISQGALGLGAHEAPPERLVRTLLDRTAAWLEGGPVPVQDWLASYRRQVPELVADRMIRAGELRRERVRRLTRTTTRYLPTRATDAFLASQRLGSYLRTQVQIDERDALLAILITTLADAPGPLELDAAGVHHVRQLRPLLSPTMQDLLTITESAVAAGLRNPRV